MKVNLGSLQAGATTVMQSFFEIIVMFIEYLAHTMSFLRVGAFVLVHAGMMLVVFTLADMAAGMMPVYIIIVIIGNIIVTCLECLLVCIQVLRSSILRTV